MGYARGQSTEASKLVEIDYTNRAKQTSEFDRTKLVSSIKSGGKKDKDWSGYWSSTNRAEWVLWVDQIDKIK